MELRRQLERGNFVVPGSLLRVQHLEKGGDLIPGLVVHDFLQQFGAEPSVGVASPDSRRDIESTADFSLCETVDELGCVVKEGGDGLVLFGEVCGFEVNENGRNERGDQCC